MISAVCFQRVERRPLLAQKAQRCGDVLRALTVAERPRNRAFHLLLQRYFLREDIRAPRRARRRHQQAACAALSLHHALRFSQRRMNEHHTAAVIHAVIARPQIAARQMHANLVPLVAAQNLAQNHFLRLAVVHRADAIQRPCQIFVKAAQPRPNALMLLSGKRARDGLANRFFQLQIGFVGNQPDVRPQSERQSARRFQLRRVLDLRRPAQNDRPLHQLVLLI